MKDLEEYNKKLEEWNKKCDETETKVKAIFDALLKDGKYTAMFVNMVKMFSEKGSVGAALAGLLKFDGSGAMKIIMPLAISFIIFQSISYIADVYTKKTEPSKNILTFALYMTNYAVSQFFQHFFSSSL